MKKSPTAEKRPKHFFARTFAAAFIFVFLFSSAAFSKTLNEYQKDLRIAHDATDELRDELSLNGDELDPKTEREMLELIRKSVLPVEKVEYQGLTIETDNKWLYDALENYGRESDADARAEILSGVIERIGALQKKLAELEAAVGSNRSKDEDKRKLSEILNREEYRKPEPEEESLVAKFLRKIQELLDRSVPLPQQSPIDVPNEGLRPISLVLQILVYVVVIGAIAFLLYKFAPFVFDKYHRRAGRQRKERVVLGEIIAADAVPQTIFDEAERLAREGNLRAAVRKGYVALLCELNDRKIVGLAQHKTNRDYLRDTHRHPKIYENMTGLTESFERHWYGRETVEESDWDEFRQGYKKVVS